MTVARLNIEDCWWTDPRRSALVRLLGDEGLADGRAIRAWRLAQEFWKHGRKLVPINLFETLQNFTELVRVGLAEARDGGVYIRGSSAYLDWTIEQKEKASRGGKTSAKRPRDAQGRLQAKSKQTPSEAQVKPKLIQVSVSASVSGSHSDSKNEESIGAAGADALPMIAEKNLGLGRATERGAAKTKQAQKANHFVGAYVKAYQTRYPGTRPEDLNDGKTRGQILAWIKEYPLERACELIQVYFQMDTKWFGAKGYDFITFRSNLNKIGQALDSGRDPDGNAVDWSKINLGGEA